METIRNLVESYTGIINKTIRDLVPKTVMFMMVNRMKDYIQTDLLPMIYASGNQDSLMEESTESARRRDETIKMYHTCRDALQLISEVSSKTGEFSELSFSLSFNNLEQAVEQFAQCFHNSFCSPHPSSSSHPH